MIVGAQKSGTTSLYDYVTRHPDVTPAVRKEVHYLDAHWDRGEEWYRSHFPLRSSSRRITGEATPAYLVLPDAPGRARATFPDARLLAVLRDPVERAWSHFHHEVAKGFEQRGFAAAVRDELRREPLASDETMDAARLHHAYLARGRYAEQLERWLAEFPGGQLLVLDFEQLRGDPPGVMAEVFGHLGLEPYEDERYAVRNRRPHPSIDPTVRGELADYFQPHNERLNRLLGRTFAWS